MAARVLGHHPLTGVGPEGYRIAFPEGSDDHYVATYGTSPLPDRAHDSLLDVAVTTGLPGAVIYVALLACVAVFLGRALRRQPPWVAGVAAGVIAYGAAALALFPLAELDPAVWLLAGLVVAQCARGEELVAVRVALRRPLAVAVAALAAVAAVAGARDILADHSTRSALAALAAGDGPAAVRRADRAAGLRPDQIEYRLAAARARAAPDTPSAIDLGLAQLAAGRGVSPGDPRLNDEQGRLRLERALRSGAPADLAAAVADLRNLVARDPRDVEDQLRLGVAEAQAGDAAAAEDAWVVAERLAPASSSAATDLATLFAGQGRWSLAADAARRALARDPGDTQAAQVLADSRSHLGT